MFLLNRWLPLPSVLAATLGVAHAQSIPEVVVTATRLERPIAESLVDLTVIDAAEIARSGATSVSELLRARAGIEISQNGGAGALSGLFLRGMKNSQTLVLVDGVRLENPSAGGGNVEYLPLSAIERIEVVRGPASALYGSGAIGGVVHLFTRQGAGPSTTASIGLGSQRSAQWQAGIARGANEGRTQWSLGVSGDRTDGYETTRPGAPDHQADRDGHRRASLNAAFSHRVAPDWQLSASALASRGRTEYDDAFSTPDTARFDYRSRALGMALKGRPAPAWQMELRAGETSIDHEYAAFDYAPRSRSRSVLWLNSLAAPIGRVDLGVERVNQRVEGRGVNEGDFAYARTRRHTDSVFAAWEWSHDAHRLRVQARHDRIQTVGSEPTAALGYAWQFAPAWHLRASVASSFRAPTFDDLYSPFGANPALRAERGRGVELALQRRAADGPNLQWVLFDNRVRDAIELDADFVPRNLARLRARGVTGELAQRWAGLDWRARVTLQQAQGERSDAPEPGWERLARRARAFGSLSVNGNLGEWRVGAQWTLQGDRVDTRGERLAGYGIVDLNLSRPAAPGWELLARVGNLGDRRYETAAGYRMPPRILMLTARYTGR